MQLSLSDPHTLACGSDLCASLPLLQAGRKALVHPDISTAAVMPFVQPSLFLRFDRDAGGCISLSLLLHYISLQTSALRLVSLSLALPDAFEAPEA